MCRIRGQFLMDPPSGNYICLESSRPYVMLNPLEHNDKTIGSISTLALLIMSICV